MKTFSQFVVEKDTHITKDGKVSKKGLWYNIHQKRKRGEKPNPPGHPDRPSAQDLKRSQNEANGEFTFNPRDTVTYQNLDNSSKARRRKTLQTCKEATYKGKKVPLNKPMPGDVKKSKVYVDPDGDGKAKKVNFGDKNMTIKKNIPARRKSFRARHNCDNPGPKDKARYWSCKAW
jgi:hypothetical protein